MEYVLHTDGVWPHSRLHCRTIPEVSAKHTWPSPSEVRSDHVEHDGHATCVSPLCHDLSHAVKEGSLGPAAIRLWLHWFDRVVVEVTHPKIMGERSDQMKR